MQMHSANISFLFRFLMSLMSFAFKFNARCCIFRLNILSNGIISTHVYIGSENFSFHKKSLTVLFWKVDTQNIFIQVMPSGNVFVK